MSRLTGINWGNHFVERTDDWLTPPSFLEALGDFDLDPCTPYEMPWQTAERRYTIADDGLLLPWSGRIWLNPPYRDIEPWMQRMAAHNNGIALVFARTETAWWFNHVWYHASAALWIRGRVTFHKPDGELSKVGHSTSPKCSARLRTIRCLGSRRGRPKWIHIGALRLFKRIERRGHPSVLTHKHLPGLLRSRQLSQSHPF